MQLKVLILVISFFQVQPIASYGLFFFTEHQTIYLITGVSNMHWKEKQER